MLRRLSVSNYILIDSLEIEFDPRLNIITGETGAGKSILLGALGLLLGNKNEGAALRDTQRNCVIEGVFDIAAYGLRPFFEANDLDYADEAVVRRILTPAGKSRAYINDLPVQLAQLREFGSRLIDIHSQHQNLILASEEFRTEALDTVAGNGELRAAYCAKYERLQELQRTCARLRAEADAARRDEEWLRYQSEELTAARLRAGEVAELEAEQAVLANADRIGEAITAVRNAFDGDEIGCWRRSRTPRWRSDGWAGVIPTPQTCPGGCVRRSKSSKTSSRRSPRTANASRPTPNGCRRWTTVSIRSIRFARSTVRPTRAN